MATRRFIQIWFDVNAQILRDDAGNELRYSLFPFINYGEQVLVNLQLVNDSTLDPYTGLEGDESYEASIDREFNTPLLMVQTTNGGINQTGDWGPGGDADPTQGQISIRMSGATTGFQYKIGQSRELPGTKMELIAVNGADEIMDVFRMSFKTRGMIKFLTTVSSDPAGDFVWFTDPATGKQGLKVINDDGEVLQILVPAS